MVPVTSASLFGDGQKALGITHCQPGVGLDLTRDLEIWTFVEFLKKPLTSNKPNDVNLNLWIDVVAGNGVGKFASTGEICISSFANDLLWLNLGKLVPPAHYLRLEIVFPFGTELAKRTSNEAFGVVDGLALIGTQPETQSSASPDQLQQTLERLRSITKDNDSNRHLTLVIGENGLEFALRLGLKDQSIIKAGNWLGPVIVEAAKCGVERLLLFGYHGKLVKLAGSIFHTHHHLADARLEVLTALAVREGLPLSVIQALSQSTSMEAALNTLEEIDSSLATKLWFSLANAVEHRTNSYLSRYGTWSMQIGATLFDRQRRLRWAGSSALQHLRLLGVTLDP